MGYPYTSRTCPYQSPYRDGGLSLFHSHSRRRESCTVLRLLNGATVHIASRIRHRLSLTPLLLQTSHVHAVFMFEIIAGLALPDLELFPRTYLSLSLSLGLNGDKSIKLFEHTSITIKNDQKGPSFTTVEIQNAG